jgi:hypothetical protein
MRAVPAAGACPFVAPVTAGTASGTSWAGSNP